MNRSTKYELSGAKKAIIILIGSMLFFGNCNSDQPKKLSGVTETIEVEYMNWACDCADFAQLDDLKTYYDNIENDSFDVHFLETSCIFIEPANRKNKIPKEYYNETYRTHYLKLTGQFYQDKGIPNSYDRKTSAKPNKAKVFRYESFELVEKQHRLSEEYSDSVKIQLENKNEMAIDTVTEIDTVNWRKFISKYNFATFSTEVFTGKLANPDFTGSELAPDKQANEFMSNYMKDYVDFWTENDEGINFGGHYTIIEMSCGCMCQLIHIVDRISGKIFAVQLSGKWGYLYQSDSKLLIANSELFTSLDSLTHYCNRWGIVPELYVWTGKKFKRIQ